MAFGKKKVVPVPDMSEWYRRMQTERLRQVVKGYSDEHDIKYGIVHLLDEIIDNSRRGNNLEAATIARQIKNIFPEFVGLSDTIKNIELLNNIQADDGPRYEWNGEKLSYDQLMRKFEVGKMTANQVREAMGMKENPNQSDEKNSGGYPDGTIRIDKPDGPSEYILPDEDYRAKTMINTGWPMGQIPEKLNKRAEILRHAEDLINGDRAQTYGPPEISFGRIADIWDAMGYRRHVQMEDMELGITKAENLDAIDAALMLEGMKLSRAAGSHGANPDDWVDMAGYAGLGGELSDEGDIPEVARDAMGREYDDPNASSILFTQETYYGENVVRCGACDSVMKSDNVGVHLLHSHPGINRYRTETTSQ